MQSLMECYEIVGGLKRLLHYKINMSKKYTWRSVVYISIILLYIYTFIICKILRK